MLDRVLPNSSNSLVPKFWDKLLWPDWMEGGRRESGGE